jgi:hypothetical protein
MVMPPRLRKLALTVHVTCSVGWLGAAAAYLGLVVAALTRQDAQVVRAAYLAMEPITWFAIVPLAIASVLTGLVESLGTQWGLFRHRVLFKFVLTVLATAVLLGNTQTVRALTAAAAETSALGISGLQGQLIHVAGGLLVLIITTVLAVYKPRGVTPYGRRKQRVERNVSHS